MEGKSLSNLKNQMGLLLITLFLLLSLGGSSLSNVMAQPPPMPIASQSSPIPPGPDDPSNGFTFFRDQFLGMINLTLEDYDALHPKDREIANQYINALWGVNNGTFTEEEAQDYIQANSPETLFAPGNILAFFDLFRWFSELYYYPSVFSIPHHNDERFEIHFIARAPFLERIRRVSVDLITNKGPQRLNLAEIYQPVDTGRVVGKEWVYWHPYMTTT